MDEITLPDLGFTWEEAVTIIKTTGVDFAINLAIAIIIFYVGRMVARFLTRTRYAKCMQSQEVDKILETFCLQPGLHGS